MSWTCSGLYNHHFVNERGEILATLHVLYGSKEVMWKQRRFIDLNAAKYAVEKEFGAINGYRNQNL